ncbi:MAG: VCBS repeat-containing protein [Myxococcota bacterium]
MNLAWRSLALGAVAVLGSACVLLPEDPSSAADADEGNCFDPIRIVELDPPLLPERWVAGRVDGSGMGSLVGISTNDLGTGEFWIVTLLTGTPGGPPFERRPAFELDLGFFLSSTRMHLRDIDGDGHVDLGMFGTARVAVAYGPLETGQPVVVEQELPGLLLGTNADFMDFDGDGVLDIVMVHEGDDLHSYRALPDRTYELAQEGEFHSDIYCIEQLVAHWDGATRFAARGVKDSCGLVDEETRVAVFEVGLDGSFTQDAATDFTNELVLRSLGEFLTDSGDEVFINDTIFSVQSGSLIARTNVSSDLRGDFDGDGVFDHMQGAGSSLSLSFGEAGGVNLVQGIGLERPDFEPIAVVDVDGDGVDEIVGSGEDTLEVVGPYLPCELVDEPTGP